MKKLFWGTDPILGMTFYHFLNASQMVVGEIYENFDNRGGSRISGKRVHMYKGVGFALLILSNFY